MNIAVLGAGAWGTAMAIHLQRQGNQVTLVSRRNEHALALASERENRDYLPGQPLPNSLQIGCELAPVLMEADIAMLACPSSGLRALCEKVADALAGATRLKMLVTLCKGLEKGSLESSSQVLADVLPQLAHGVLSGPTNAAEVASAKPTAIVFASETEDEWVQQVQAAINGPSLRVYLSTDVIGVQLAGSLKNIYAIGAGLCDGMRLGDNAKAAYITRALYEMARVGVLLGGRIETFHGLSGVGDLIATCNGLWSRNRTFGEELAKGHSIDQLFADRKTVVEGYWATECFHQLLVKKGAEAPIMEQVYNILYKGVAPRDAVGVLMSRQLKME